jgi:hypothetical protein
MLQWNGGTWPPEGDADRLSRYARYQALFEGDHAKAFENLSAFVPSRRRRIIYLTANYAGLISKLCADLLFGETPVFNAPDGPGLDSLKALIRANSLPTVLYESELSASFRGDAVFRVRRGKRHEADPEESVIIEEVPAYSYFAETSADNVREVVSESIAWVHRVPGQRTCYLRVEEHTPGLIRQSAYQLNEGSGKVGVQVPLSRVYGDATPMEEESTGIGRSMLVHVPNFRHGSRLWGMSDYYDLESLFDAVNNRLSKTDAILDRHAAPKLVLPAGATDARGEIRLSDMDLYEVGSVAEGSVVRYVTWDAKLEAAFTHLEHLQDQIFRMAEVSPAAFGLDKAGSIESGRAMRMRFIRTQAKIARKRQYFDAGIRRLLSLAQELQAIHGGPDPVDIEIHWMDGIPDDYIEAVEVERSRVEAGLSSRETAIRRIDNVDEAQARNELQRIRGESPVPATPPAGDIAENHPSE